MGHLHSLNPSFVGWRDPPPVRSVPTIITMETCDRGHPLSIFDQTNFGPHFFARSVSINGICWRCKSREGTDPLGPGIFHNLTDVSSIIVPSSHGATRAYRNGSRFNLVPLEQAPGRRRQSRRPRPSRSKVSFVSIYTFTSDDEGLPTQSDTHHASQRFNLMRLDAMGHCNGLTKVVDAM